MESTERQAAILQHLLDVLSPLFLEIHAICCLGIIAVNLNVSKPHRGVSNFKSEQSNYQEGGPISPLELRTEVEASKRPFLPLHLTDF